MTFYFAWVHVSEVFDQQVHCRQDIDILSFDVRHNESQLPLLTVTVPHFKASEETYCYFSYRPDEGDKNSAFLLFKGVLYHAPLNPSTHTWTLHFKGDFDSACFANLHLKKEKELESDITPLDASFFKECDGDSPLTQRLQRECSVVEVDRITQNVKVCDLLRTEGIFHAEDVFDKNIQVHVLESPYTHVDVTIIADWVQKDEGEVDITSCVHKAFPEGRINTLTPHYMEKSFPQPGECMENLEYSEGCSITSTSSKRGSKRSGYRIVESWIQSFHPPDTGVLGLYPRVSPLFWEKKSDDACPVPVYFKRVWYQSSLVVEWRYRQRRKEIITLSLSNKGAQGGIDRRKKITLTLKKLAHDQGSSFFKSILGKRALVFAHDYALCFLKASTRCLELSFRLPLLKGMHLSTSQMVDISSLLKRKGFDVHHPLFAKIVSYRLIQKGVYGYAFVRCAFSFPMVAPEIMPKSASVDNVYVAPYVEEGGVDNDLVRPHPYQEMFDGLVSQIHPKGIVDTRPLHTTFIVEEIHLENDVSQQLQRLSDNAYPRMGALKNTLKRYPTTFSIQFQDLRTYPVLEESAFLKCEVRV